MEIFTMIAAFLFGALLAVGGFIIGTTRNRWIILPSIVLLVYLFFGWPFKAMAVWPFIYAEAAGIVATNIYLIAIQTAKKTVKETNYKVKAIKIGQLYPGTRGRQPQVGQVFWVIEERTSLRKDSSLAPIGHECGNDPCFVCEGLPDVSVKEVHIYGLQGSSYGWQPAENFVRYDG
ncbi:MAG TPA: hypothetical protein P5080_03360 [Candidatus Paceibacterota bacterium]|nr:hypothetical protein [Candidatus Pacearchaeota archaeon]HRZ51006.1 hypothetical protein [Candidatus Paceibacterota bacterium]HSA36727.1 hypothetical protein [Candidatus Paceibacterota bacterium]